MSTATSQGCVRCAEVTELASIIRSKLETSNLPTAAHPADVDVLAAVLRHGFCDEAMAWKAWSKDSPRRPDGNAEPYWGPHGFAGWIVTELRARGYEIVGGMPQGGVS